MLKAVSIDAKRADVQVSPTKKRGKTLRVLLFDLNIRTLTYPDLTFTKHYVKVTVRARQYVMRGDKSFSMGARLVMI